MSLQRVYLHILALMVMLSCATGLLLKLSDVYVSEKKHSGPYGDAELCNWATAF